MANMETGFNTLVCEDDNLEHPDNFFSQQGQPGHRFQKTYVSIWSPVVAGLTGLAVVLLMLNIGLGIYHSNMKGNQLTLEDVEDIRSELNDMEASYKAAFESTNNYKKQLDSKLKDSTKTKWELEHQTKRNNDYQKNMDKITKNIALLKYQLPKTEQACRLCLPDWVWFNSMCYFFPFESMGYKSWSQARHFCQLYGGDLAVINSTVKQNSTVMHLVQNLEPNSSVGFWVGLRNLAREDSWKWPDGKLLVEGYWMDGNPTGVKDDVCVAVYARENFFKAWGDTNCNAQNKKWICEKAEHKWG
ncbi:hypothetical protein fugu_016571 [Takifugu bimaculatus]|uniref:C-type lectin domain-containing protein n=1 Tax=Takifugu bimaculatus TaxID=433685 RepID=A0A4Z2BUV4_9TELE|nr:hypothetical protein fugu_016571 [Takifugu bimaculatus]